MRSVAGTESSRQTMVCGVPQGSLLGPLLSLIFLTALENISTEFLQMTLIFLPHLPMPSNWKL